MKVKELFEEKLDVYLNRLVSKMDVEKLGGGAYSQVFQHPHYGNMVVKVFTDKDAVYKKYLAWCMKNQSNTFVPQIVEHHPHEDVDGHKFHIVFMQKMTPIKTDAKLALELEKALGLEPSDEDVFKSLSEALHDMRMEELFHIIDSNIGPRSDKNFDKVWKHIKSYGSSKFDLHTGNAMMRGKEFVLTDPVANDPGDSRVDDY